MLSSFLLRVQELMGGEQRETGRIPRTVECHLTSDLCDSCVPGDTVTVAGIVRVINDGTNLYSIISYRVYYRLPFVNLQSKMNSNS